jgi:hypothetical protein
MSRARKHEAYSWRLSPKLKAELEAAARDEKASVDAVLSRLVREWLAGRVRSSSADNQYSGLMEDPALYKGAGRSPTKKGDAEKQRRLHEMARRAMGTASVGGPSATNAEVRKVMGEVLEAKYRASQRRAPRRSG